MVTSDHNQCLHPSQSQQLGDFKNAEDSTETPVGARGTGQHGQAASRGSHSHTLCGVHPAAQQQSVTHFSRAEYLEFRIFEGRIFSNRSTTFSSSRVLFISLLLAFPNYSCLLTIVTYLAVGYPVPLVYRH